MGIRETTIKRQTKFCDSCNRDTDNLRTCQICRKEGCYSCLSFICLYEKTPGLIDLGFNVCSDCKQAGDDVCGTSFRELMQDEVKRADIILMNLLDRWRDWAKERAANAGSDVPNRL